MKYVLSLLCEINIYVICMLLSAKAIEDPVQFYAERLFSCMKGVGTNDKMLIRIVVSRSEVSIRISQEDRSWSFISNSN